VNEVTSNDDECMHGLLPITCSICRQRNGRPQPKSVPSSQPPERRGSPSKELTTQYRKCKSCSANLPHGENVEECDRCVRKRARLERRATRARTATPSWTLRFERRRWQGAAIAEWRKAGCKGVIEAATGTGKTAVAFAAMEELHQEHGDRLRVAIIVPTRILARQWRAELMANLGIPPRWIGEQHTDAQVEYTSSHPILIAVVNSARTRLATVMDAWQRDGHVAFLVVDECHRAGSEFNSKIFDGHYDFSLGLSATPEREDKGHEEHVYPGLGRPVYSYPLRRALDDDVLAPLTSIDLYVDFSGPEQSQWLLLKDQIADSFRTLKHWHPHLEQVAPERFLKEVSRLAERQDPTALRLQKVLADRRALLANAEARSRCLKAILDWVARTGHRALVFHETITAAEESHRYLCSDLNVRAELDHSKRHSDDRASAADSFRTNNSQVLVAVRALDEGVDVPDATVAVIAAGSRSRRQRIQRFGRVLRRAEDKQAVVISVLVRGTPEESAVGGRDAELIGASRVRHHRWPEVPIAQAVTTDASTYKPAAPQYALEDFLTLPDLVEGDQITVLNNRSTVPSRLTGGYSVRQEDFSPNAWHDVEDVRRGSGVPSSEFDGLRRDIRRTYRQALDPTKVEDESLIHGQEIDAIRRQWREEERRLRRLDRMRRRQDGRKGA
jgi:superfamily II DNA or RNA helicase